jgi:replication-associated recombination protein RarA
MTKLWLRDEHVMINECIFADAYVKEDVRDFLSPACTDNLLLWGLPGTGKSAVVKAIAYERYGTTDLQDENVVVLDCKDQEQAKQLNSKYLRGWYSWARLNSNCPILILDELDELTDAQQRALTAFINSSSLDDRRSMVLATTNVDLRDRTASAKAFSDALLSRFNTKLQMRQQLPADVLPLAQRKLQAANVLCDNAGLLDVLARHCDPTSKTIDLRTVQTVVNKLIRRSTTTAKKPPSKPSLQLI